MAKKKAIPSIHVPIQTASGAMEFSWYMFMQWLAESATQSDLSNYFTKEETEALLGTKVNIVSEPNKVYGTDNDGNQYIYSVSYFAVDNDAVHKAGTETITGNKTFSGSTTIRYLTLGPESTSSTSIEGGEIKFVGGAAEPNAGKDIKLDRYNGSIRIFGADSHDNVKTIFRANIEQGTLTGVTPTEDSTGSIQLDTVGARNTKLQNYSLDSSVVHNTGIETIGGNKTFSGITTFNTTANFKSVVYLINTSYGLFDATASSKYFNFSDKNGKTVAWVESRINDSGVAGASKLNIWARTYTDNTYSASVDSVIALVARPDGVKYATGPAPTANDMSSTQIDTVGARNTNIRDFAYKHITNCITEIPQDINLTLSDGTLTLKAGSKAYLPDGTTYSNTADVTHTPAQFSGTATWVIAMTGNNSFFPRNINNCVSGAGATAVAGYAYDTTTNVISWYTAQGTVGGTNCSLPIAIIHTTNSVIDRIDQVFNGFGWIGTKVFVLPGVKALAPNGRNADGTLKNTIVQLSTVKTADAYNSKYILNNGGISPASYTNYAEQETQPSFANGFWYQPSTNTTYNINNSVLTRNTSSLYAFEIFAGSGISAPTGIKIKQPFHAIDYNDMDLIAHQAMPSDKYMALSTSISTGYSFTAPADGYLSIVKGGSASDWMYIRNNTSGLNIGVQYVGSLNGRLCVPVSKNQTVQINWSGTGTVSELRFIYANGTK